VTYYRPGTSGEDCPPDVAVIRLLAVRPEMRGSGLGRVLAEECMRRARAAGARAVGLHTTMMMATAKAMYERMGFVPVPEHDFSPAPDLLVMGFRLEL
jgi:ribosomal protein S18 acetylase RimI-like enzyme